MSKRKALHYQCVYAYSEFAKIKDNLSGASGLSILNKYKASHRVILCGDFNATLLPERNNPHDKMLKDFVRENDLVNTVLVPNHTFFSHTGMASSQLDYILTLNMINSVETKVNDFILCNTSSHVHLSTTLNATVAAVKKTVKSIPKKKVRYRWDRITIENFEAEIEKELLKHPNLDNKTVERRLEVITGVLIQAAKRGVPSVVTRLKGPGFKLSPSVKMLMKKRKEAFFQWKKAGRPSKDHILSQQKKQTSKNLRKQVRKEFAVDRQKFLTDVMDNPSDRNFYRLIKRNQGQNEGTGNVCIRFKGEDIFDSTIQGENFSVYFEDLATPKNSPGFDEHFYQLNKVQHACIQEICEQSEDVIRPFTGKEVHECVKSLNSNKSPDEFGLVSEHLKYGLQVILPALVKLYNDIIASGTIPANFKSGIIHPIHKKGKDPTSMDNYRGITVTSVFGKLFEALLLTRMTELNQNQSDLQYGFTKGLTPTMASLLLTEAEADAKMRKRPLYLATQKAFDVVDHTILLNKLYEEGINQKLWLIVRELYTGLSAKIKWKSDLSDSFGVFQGVRQGGILSTHFYKVYVNGFLVELRMNSLGKYIGCVYAGCPACADDVLFMTEDPEELQVMFAIARSYSGGHRFIVHPQKTKVVCKH